MFLTFAFLFGSKIYAQGTSELKDDAIYNAEDSTIFSKDQSKAFLYHNAVVEYENVILKAAFIAIDFDKKELYATPLIDSAGNIYGKPVFVEGGEEYKVDTISYNFDTKKGIVKNVHKQEGDIFTWTNKGKKMPDDITYADEGHFTTCNADHPHFRIRFKKGKIIPKDKIVTGPIYMEIGDVPVPLVIPFSYLPNKQGRSNGLIFPTYGFVANRGYSLRGLGYYRGLGSNADIALMGDIYSRGSYAVTAKTRYNVRYKYRGDIQLNYAHNIIGETDVGKYTEDKSFFVRWSHQQSPKANPYGNFSARAEFGSSDYNKLNSYNAQNYLKSQFSSSVAYSTRLWNNYNLTINLGHSQNSKNKMINVTAPEISFSTPRINPFRRKVKIGKSKWYEDINLTYSMNAKNNLNVADSMIREVRFEDFENGVNHNIPISYSQKLGYFNWSVNAKYNERWYFKTIDRYYQQDTVVIDSDTIYDEVVDDYNAGFKAAREFSVSTGLSTRIYGMYNYKKGPLKAIRHVITPSVSASYRPDFGTDFYGYFRTYTDKNGDTITYSIFDGGMYGQPPQGKSGALSLSVANTLEIKVRNRKDTINPSRKIKLIENLTFSTNYDFAKDSLNLAPLSISGRTKIIEGLSVLYRSNWDFYALDSTGRRTNTFNWENGDKWLRNTNSSYDFSLNYRFSADKLKSAKERRYKSKMGTEAEQNEVNSMPESYVDFNVPWSININYSLRYTQVFNVSNNMMQNDMIQTLNLNGDINITKKWKIGFRTGWDFESMDLTYTSIDIYRDLHCWEMIFNWIPMGFIKSYNLTVRVKSPLLQDLKINKRKDWRDY
jgi:hypothetical protein